VSDVRTLAGKVAAVVRTRRDRARVRRALAGHPPADADAQVVLYFADPVVNLYQVRQWYEPLRRLSEQHPVVVVSRFPDSTLALLRVCPLPVVHVSTIAELERWLETRPVAAFFYVNQNRENFSTLRFSEPAHVFLSHGESDKASYMASNQLKAYDAVLVAGPAAVRRIEGRLYGVDSERLVPVGRPQVDVAHETPDLPDDGRLVVLYAPTWEGDRPSMAYSSVRSHGLALVEALTSDPRFRVVYRPHPRTGLQDRAYAAAHRAIAARLRAADEADASARHMVDTDSPFGWHLQAADICITDVSAVAFDWLATGKPLVLTRPAPEAAVDPGSLATRLPTLAPAEARHIIARIDALLEGPSEPHRELAADYFGDTTPGASMARFLGAAARIVHERSAAQAARRGGA
jgi:hypothetical protein